MSKKRRLQYPGPENANSYRIRGTLRYKVLFNLKELLPVILTINLLILRKRNGHMIGAKVWESGGKAKKTQL